MTVSKTDTETSWVDPDDAPELTDEWFGKADYYVGEKLVRRGGRPVGSNKEQVTLRLDRDMIERFRSEGPGWQSRMNAALRKAVGL